MQAAAQLAFSCFSIVFSPGLGLIALPRLLDLTGNTLTGMHRGVSPEPF